MDLQVFCNMKKGGQERPFSQGGYTYATDGGMIIRIPRLNTVPEVCGAPDPDTLPFWRDRADVKLLPLPSYELPSPKSCSVCEGSGFTEECEECGGSGIISFSSRYNEYSDECKTCDGEGVNVSDEEDGKACRACNGSGDAPGQALRVKWGGSLIDGRLLERIKDLPGVKITEMHGVINPCMFFFDGGDGLIMPLRS